MTKRIKQNEKETPVTVSVAQVPAGGTEKITSTGTSDNKVAITISPITKVLEEKPLKKEKEKNKKVKMIRDSFTLPESDYVKLSELKKKCLDAGVHVKKSELVRAGLLSLSKLPSASLLNTISQVEIIKTGRPTKG